MRMRFTVISSISRHVPGLVKGGARSSVVPGDASDGTSPPIWLIRCLDLDTLYHNWTVYHRSRDTHFTWPASRHVSPRPGASARRADLDPAPEGKARAPDQGGDRRGRDRPGRHPRTRRRPDPGYVTRGDLRNEPVLGETEAGGGMPRGRRPAAARPPATAPP